MKKLIKILTFTFICAMIFANVISAVTPYSTYTYSINGDVLESPDAYVPDAIVDSEYIGLDEDSLIDALADVEVDDKNNVYLVETTQNRVIVLDRYYKLKYQITEFVNEQMIPDKFNNPQGVFVSSEYIYVCDAGNARIVMFDLDGKYVKTVLAPESNLFDEGDIYTPVAVAVDDYGRMFVVSSTTNQGIIVMGDDGEFFGFIGAQKVTYNAIDLIWNTYFKKNAEGLVKYVPTEYNNITIDEKNFIYVTISSIDPADQQSAITSKSKSGDYAPVKKLNASGTDVMRRNGFYPPSGEVKVSDEEGYGNTNPSKIIDVAVGPEGTWSIIDEERSKIFTYDEDGNLLFAFGDNGVQSGNISSIEAIVYQGDKMLVIDKGNKSLAVYRRTQYGDVLLQALSNQNNRLYDKSLEDWQEILKRNNNFDVAYIGIGQALFRHGQYEEAGKYFKTAYDVSKYSEAYAETRKEWSNKYFWTIPVVIVAVCVLVVKVFGISGKINKKAQLKVGRRTLVEEISYATHVSFHPFDGFWDLKHEQRGSPRAAFVFLGLTILAFFYQSIGTGYIFSGTSSASGTIFSAIISVVMPVMLFVVANWCLTTLLEGEGSFRDVFVATCYGIAPLPLLIILSTAVSNFLTANESAVITLINTIAFIWVGILLFFGVMVTHGYSFGKNVATILFTIIAMAFIMFLAVLFSSLMTKIVSFVYSIAEEINYRI